MRGHERYTASGARRDGWSVAGSRRGPGGGNCAVVGVTMDDFRWSWWWERGAEDTAELRNTVSFRQQ
jgi:hypothetical protein